MGWVEWNPRQDHRPYCTPGDCEYNYVAGNGYFKCCKCNQIRLRGELDYSDHNNDPPHVPPPIITPGMFDEPCDT
eukprot:g78606.t1